MQYGSYGFCNTQLINRAHGREFGSDQSWVALSLHPGYGAGQGILKAADANAIVHGNVALRAVYLYKNCAIAPLPRKRLRLRLRLRLFKFLVQYKEKIELIFLKKLLSLHFFNSIVAWVERQRNPGDFGSGLRYRYTQAAM